MRSITLDNIRYWYPLQKPACFHYIHSRPIIIKWRRMSTDTGANQLRNSWEKRTWLLSGSFHLKYSPRSAGEGLGVLLCEKCTFRIYSFCWCLFTDSFSFVGVFKKKKTSGKALTSQNSKNTMLSVKMQWAIAQRWERVTGVSVGA